MVFRKSVSSSIRTKSTLLVCLGILFAFIFLSGHATAQKLCAGVLGNAIIFKDFGSGTPQYNTAPQSTFGFSTTFKAWNKAQTNDGYYSIVNKIPNDFQLQGTNVWLSGNDHTSNDGKGYMLLVNGDQTLGEFYRDTVDNLCLGGTYEFSSYLANIFKPANAFPTPQTSIPPQVRFEIRDLTGKVLDSVSTGNINNTATLSWNRYGLTFAAPSTSIILVMVSTASSGTGNDIVLDDIAFKPCIPATISITPLLNVCENGGGTFTVSIQGNADYKYSKWQKKDKGGNWNYIGNTIQSAGSLNYTVDLALSNLPFADDSTLYRLILATGEPNLADPSSACNVISPISLLRVYRYPILKITAPAPVCGQVVDLTKPAILAGSTLYSAILSYYTSQQDATDSTHAMTLAQAKTVATSGQYFIRASVPSKTVCITTQPVNVTIESPRKVGVTAPTSLCKDLPAFTATISIQTRVTNLIWTSSTSNAVLQSGTGTSLSFSPTSAELAKDSIWIKVASNEVVVACPNVKDSVKVKFYNAASVILPTDTLFCENATISNFGIQAKSLNNPSTVAWQTSNAAVTPNPSTGLKTSLSFSNQNTTFLVIATASKNGCNPRSDTMKVNFGPPPPVNAGQDTTVCLGMSILRKVPSNPLRHYKWGVTVNNVLKDSVSLTNSLQFTPAADSKVTLTVKTDLGCQSSDDFTITIEPFKKVSLAPIPSLCKDLPTFTASATKTNVNNLQWTSSTSPTVLQAGTNPSLAFTPNSAELQKDSIWIKVASNDAVLSCPNVKDSVKVKFYEPAEISLPGDTTFCENAMVQNLGLQAKVSNNPSSITWQSDRASIVPNPTSGNSTSLQFSNQTTPFSIIGTVAKNGCNPRSDTMNILFSPIPVAQAGADTSYCLGSLFSRTVPSLPSLHYKWGVTVNHVLKDSVSFTNHLQFSPTQASTVTLTVTSALGCQSSDDFNISTIPAPTITLPSHLCFATGLNLSPVVNPIPTGGTFTWAKDNTVLNSSSLVSDLSLASSGTYTFQYKDQSCLTMASTLVTDPPVLSLPNKHACYGASTTLVAGAIKKGIYYWNGGSGTYSNTYPVNASSTPLLVSLKVIDSLGCQNTISATVTGVPNPNFSLASLDVCYGQTGNIKASLVDSSLENTYALDYQWEKDNQPISSPSWKQLDFTTSGTYRLTLGIGECTAYSSQLGTIYPLPILKEKALYTYCDENPETIRLATENKDKHTWYQGNKVLGTNQDLEVHPDSNTRYLLVVQDLHGCQSSQEIAVNICCAPRLFAPNVITPFSNDVNSTLKISGKYFTKFDLTVFSRWGEVIYHTQNHEQFWDGNYKNEGMPIGVYAWMITYEGVCPEYKGPYKKVGDVTIVR
jgi:gliding motility-associated-like protein